MKSNKKPYVPTRVEPNYERHCELCNASHYYDEKDEYINDIEIGLYSVKDRFTKVLKRICCNCLEDVLPTKQFMILRWNDEKCESEWQ